MWPELLLFPIESAVNRIIRLDPRAVEGLTDLAGRTLVIEIDSFSPIQVRPGPNGITLSFLETGPVDARVSGTLNALIKTLRASDPRQTSLEISGDAGLISAFQDILIHLDIDWEAVVSRVTGGVVAHEGLLYLSRIADSARAVNTNMRQDVRDFLYDESGLAVHPAEVGEFIEEVDRLRSSCDRLAARLSRLDRHTNSKDIAR